MKWGIGAGRCGTKSLAVQEGGKHLSFMEDRLIRELAELWAHGQHTPPDENNLRTGIKWYMSWDSPLLVDWYFSLVLPLIEEEDPDAEFLYVWREPKGNITSFILGGWGFRRDLSRLLPDGVDMGKISSDLRISTIRWIVVNNLICAHLEQTTRPYKVLNVEDLTVHVHKGDGEADWADGALELVLEVCGPTVKRIGGLNA